jgi:hypothetical protein
VKRAEASRSAFTSQGEAILQIVVLL